MKLWELDRVSCLVPAIFQFESIKHLNNKKFADFQTIAGQDFLQLF